MLQSIFSKQNKNKLPYTSYYDEETFEIVKNMYATDVSTFGYKFGE